ncbi:MAG: cysteine desulfurase DndA [Pyrinomonadaceae bacterium]
MIYLDCNATTPIEPAVVDLVLHFLTDEFGNAGSRTHEFGLRAQRAVEKAREQVAKVVTCEPSEVILTSGATESNNLAILGLEKFANETGKRHIISTEIEHKAVLEPLEMLSKRGFDITLVAPDLDGSVSAENIKARLREDTILVSVMHVNNETGVIQPITDIVNILDGHPAFLHVDAAQGFGKDIPTLQSRRIDLISISGHKIYAPKGIGALIVRRRGYDRLPIQPLMVGGGQEQGLRPGTLPVHLAVGLGLASELAIKNFSQRQADCKKFRDRLLCELLPLNPVINGDLKMSLPNVVNLSFLGIDSEALMLALKNEIAISNGSACTAHLYKPSHVLKAMGLDDDSIQTAVRLSWCHLTEEPDWVRVTKIVSSLS